MVAKKPYQQNLILVYIINFLYNSFFWFAIWLLYYYHFIDNRGVAIAQAAAIITSTIIEIPSGAIADLIGKKVTIIISLVICTIGEFLLSQVSSLSQIVISAIVVSIGYAFYTGTVEALIYDTLFQYHSQSKYSKTISIFTNTTIVSIAIASIMGSLLFKYDIALPYIATAVFKFLAVFFALFLIEPKVDTRKFSLKNFLLQNKRGFSSIFSKTNLTFTLLALTIGGFYTFTWEVLDDTLIVEYGFKNIAIGVFYTILSLSAIFASSLYPKLVKKHNLKRLFIGQIVILVVSLFLSSSSLFYVGIFSLILRASLDGFYSNSSSEFINKITPSIDRATTLSTFSMIKRVPYLILSVQLGKWIDLYTAKSISIWVGLILFVICLPYTIKLISQKTKLTNISA